MTIPTVCAVFFTKFYMMSCAVVIMTSFIIPYPINSQYFKMWEVDSSGINLIEKTLSLEKYKP